MNRRFRQREGVNRQPDRLFQLIADGLMRDRIVRRENAPPLHPRLGYFFARCEPDETFDAFKMRAPVEGQ
jgi:hypothetical protein